MKKGLMAIGLAVASVLPANGQSPPPKVPLDECAALWKDYDLDDDDILSDAEAVRLKAILAVIDTNKDGTISKDEFLVACQKGVLKDVKK
jgi:hypothetical protein